MALMIIRTFEEASGDESIEKLPVGLTGRPLKITVSWVESSLRTQMRRSLTLRCCLSKRDIGYCLCD